MQKLSVEIVERMCNSHLTGCQIDFLLAISRYQDDNGKVTGVHYRDISTEMGFSIPQFYAAKKALEEKGFITCEKNNYYDHDITIVGNDYLELYKDAKENLKNKPYINTRRNIFYSKEFRKLKPGAKLLAMLLMGIIRNENGSYRKKAKDFIKEFTKRLGVKERIFRVYLTQLKEFFSIGIVKGLYRIRPKRHKVFSWEGKTEIDQYHEHEFIKICRRSHVKVENKQDIIDVRTFVKQYRDRAAAIGKDVIEIIAEGIRCSVDPVEDMFSEKPILKPKLVHLWVKRLIGISETKNGSEGANRALEGQLSNQSQQKKNSFHNFTQRSYNFNVLEKKLVEVQQ